MQVPGTSRKGGSLGFKTHLAPSTVPSQCDLECGPKVIPWTPTFLKTAFSRTCSKKVVGEPEFYKEKRYMRKKTSSLIPKKKNIHPKKKEQHQHIWKLSPHILFYGFISFFFFIVFCGNCVRVFFKNSTDHRRNRIHCTLRSSTLCFPQLLRGVVSVLLA